MINTIQTAGKTAPSVSIPGDVVLGSNAPPSLRRGSFIGCRLTLIHLPTCGSIVCNRVSRH